MNDVLEPDSRDRLHKASTLMAWLRLVRLPTVFTAISNILCGYFISRRPLVQELTLHTDLFLLLLSSMGLYLGGMVLNDVFDAALDAKERPERPIPSGQISRSAAAVLGVLLMAGGITAAAFCSILSLVIALLITVAVVAYDARLKSTPLGPFAMGTCRFLNLQLGASSVEWTDWQSGPVFIPAIALGIYIVGVTWFARSEAGTSSRNGMLLGLIVLLSALGLDAWKIRADGATENAIRGSSLVLLLLGLNLTARAAAVITRPHPGRIQKTVGLMLMSLIFLDATLVFGFTADARLSVLIIMLVAPATLLRRFIPMS